MSEPKYTIYNNLGRPVAWSKLGVMWRSGGKERLGEYYDDKIIDGVKGLIAYIDGRAVISADGAIIGETKDGSITFDYNVTMDSVSLVLRGVVVGQCFPGDHCVAAAGLALLGSELALTQ